MADAIPTPHDVLHELRSTLASRRELYPSDVEEGLLTEEQAAHRLACIEQALQIVAGATGLVPASKATRERIVTAATAAYGKAARERVMLLCEKLTKGRARTTADLYEPEAVQIAEGIEAKLAAVPEATPALAPAAAAPSEATIGEIVAGEATAAGVCEEGLTQVLRELGRASWADVTAEDAEVVREALARPASGEGASGVVALNWNGLRHAALTGIQRRESPADVRRLSAHHQARVEEARRAGHLPPPAATALADEIERATEARLRELKQTARKG